MMSTRHYLITVSEEINDYIFETKVIAEWKDDDIDKKVKDLVKSWRHGAENIFGEVFRSGEVSMMADWVSISEYEYFVLKRLGFADFSEIDND